MHLYVILIIFLFYFSSVLNASSAKKSKKTKNADNQNHLYTELRKTKHRAPEQTMFDSCLKETNFKAFLLKNCTYVDKTLLVKEIIEKNQKLIQICLPHRWGKSLNLSMLKAFFEVEVNETGHRIPPEESINRKLFIGGTINTPNGDSIHLRPLKISQHLEIMERHQGKYPVIQLNFTDIHGNTYNELKNEMIKRMQQTFQEHKYMEYIFFRDLPSKCKMLRLFTRFRLGQKFVENYVYIGLRILSHTLRLALGRPAFIFVDSYDTPFIHATMNFGNNYNEISLVRHFFEQLFTTPLTFQNFAYNPFLKQALFTGILPLTINVNWYRRPLRFNDKFYYSDFYGFNIEEINELLSKRKLNTTTNEIIRYYGGYRYKKEQNLCNPWSIMKYLQNGGKLSQYWDHNETLILTKITLPITLIEQQLQNLLQGKNISSFLKELNFLRPPRKPENSAALALLFTILYHGGYVAARVLPFSNINNLQNIVIPNEELQIVIKKSWNLN